MGERGDATASPGEALFGLPTLDLPAGALGDEGLSLPAFAHLDGRIVVVMELGEYRGLLSAASLRVREAVAAGTAARSPDRAGHSTIDRDPEVAAFLRERFPQWETIAVLRAACVARFGADRAPSASRIQTFRTRWRRR